MSQSRLITPVLIAGSLILIISFGVRASFGLFQLPIAEQFGWPRAEFSLAIAIQNLAWASARRSSRPSPSGSATAARSSPARSCMRSA